METKILLYLIAIFLVELFVFYSPAYYLCYGVFKLDKKVKDLHLAILLFIISI